MLTDICISVWVFLFLKIFSLPFVEFECLFGFMDWETEDFYSVVYPFDEFEYLWLLDIWLRTWGVWPFPLELWAFVFLILLYSVLRNWEIFLFFFTQIRENQYSIWFFFLCTAILLMIRYIIYRMVFVVESTLFIRIKLQYIIYVIYLNTSKVL